jgi:hypothetical protein
VANTPQERELVWLTKKVKDDADLIERASTYFREYESQWSMDIGDYFLKMLAQMKDQLNFKEHRLEQLAWKIVKEREENALGKVPDSSNFVHFAG